ncbi:MAG TPA: type I-U CRISPR-associated protein Csb2 [Spirochaetota bacterium]|nr:type I-U CRISPR-associated protein Csb2 [Spirochaetota bacterium]
MKLCIAFRYLTRRATASRSNDRENVEWPPHPGRFFMALVAAWAAGGSTQEEKQAIEWIETLPAPALHIPAAQAAIRPTGFVPVNDTKGNESLPATRRKRARNFPSVIVDEPVMMIWEADSLPESHMTALARLCSNVTCIGHSSSLVQVWIEPAPPEPNLIPAGDTRPDDILLRVPSPGRLEELCRDFQAGRRPGAGLWQKYRYAGEHSLDKRTVPGSVFSPDILLFRVARGAGLGAVSVNAVMNALRGSLMRHAAQPVPEIISGHLTDGRPSALPHLALFPVIDFGHEYADGHLMGCGIAIPARASREEIDECYRSIARAVDVPLVMGALGEWQLEVVNEAMPLRKAFLLSRWIGPSRSWASITPIALDRFPKKPGDAESAVLEACRYAGLPDPESVVCHRVSMHRGIPTADGYPPLPGRGPGKPQRWHCHAVLRFTEPVRGPILLGAGRYRGYGACSPIEERKT